MISTRFTIRRATASDVEVVTDLIDRAGKWLRGKGTDQWERPWPDADQRRRRILQGLGDGETWIVMDRGLAMATVSITGKANPKLWREKETRTPAVYLHRLVVAREYASARVGADLIDWAAEWGRRKYGARVLRIDVWADNCDLHSYYRRIGFKFRDFGWGAPKPRVSKSEWPSGVLMQRRLPREPMRPWPDTERFTFEGDDAPAPADEPPHGLRRLWTRLRRRTRNAPGSAAYGTAITTLGAGLPLMLLAFTGWLRGG